MKLRVDIPIIASFEEAVLTKSTKPGCNFVAKALIVMHHECCVLHTRETLNYSQ